MLPIDLTKFEAATGFDYPNGTYLLQVERSEMRTNQDGSTQRLLVHNRIMMGPGPSTQFEGKPIMNSYQLTEKGAPYLKRLFVCCGITDQEMMATGSNPDMLVGRQYVATIQKNKEGYINIVNEKPYGEWQAAIAGPQGNGAQAPAAQQAPAPAGLMQPQVMQPQAAPQQMQQPAMPQQMQQPQMAPQQPQAAPQQMQQPQMPQAAPAPQMPQAMPQQPAQPGMPAPQPVPAPAPPPGTVGQQ
jgi:hypothetical protein